MITILAVLSKVKNIVSSIILFSLFLLVIYWINPDFFNLEILHEYFRIIVSAGLAIVGIYVLYTNLNTRVLAINNLISVSIAFILLIIGLYILLGENITEIIEPAIELFTHFAPYLLSTITLIVGINLIVNKNYPIGAILLIISFILIFYNFII